MRESQTAPPQIFARCRYLTVVVVSKGRGFNHAQSLSNGLRLYRLLKNSSLATGSCHAAYATESLEHAVDIPAAIAELARIVRPGGPIAIIDKNADAWGRLETPEWERWFGRKELERLLGRHCRSVRSQPISYWEDVEPDGLFLAWLAYK